MGGRGAYSFSANMMRQRPDRNPLSAYAVASLNRGSAKGTSPDAAIGRFREQMMNAKYEFSAYVDNSGYIHALGSTGKEGSTRVAPLSSIAKEKGISTVVHNHPFGGSDGRKWGGPLSDGDLSYIAAAYAQSGGKVNRIVATSNEGTYSAVVKKKVTGNQVLSAASKAKSSLKGKKYQSEISMWRAINNAYTSEFGKIGIDITFQKQRKRNDRVVTQKFGKY